MEDENLPKSERTWQWLVEQIDKEENPAQTKKLAEELRRILKEGKAKPAIKG